MQTHQASRSRRSQVLVLSALAFVFLILLWLIVQRERLPDGVPAGYARRWLLAEVCQPPCWEGITPGTTTVSQALDLLNNNPGIIPGSANAHDGYVVWRWKGSTHGGEARYARADPQQRINEISPFYESLPGAKASFTLAEVIQRYGAPSHIRASTFYGPHGDGPFYAIMIIYQPMGLIFTNIAMITAKPELTDRLAFNRVSFYTPTDLLNLSAEPWVGFQPFDSYCQVTPGPFTQDACGPIP